MSMKHPINLTVDRIHEMDDREMYNVTDAYVKGKLSRFAVRPDDVSLLKQRELPRDEREIPLSETAELFDAIKSQLHDVLYHPTVLPRHHFVLSQMQESVQSQLREHSDQTDWRRAALGFLDLVKDEHARASVMLESQRENSAFTHLHTLIRAIEAHQEAEDADAADDRLYLITDQIKELLGLTLAPV